MPKRLLFLLCVLCLLPAAARPGRPNVAKGSWNPIEARFKPGAEKDLSGLFRYFNAQAGWPDLDQDDKGSVVKHDAEPGAQVKFWAFGVQHSKKVFHLNYWFPLPDGSQGLATREFDNRLGGSYNSRRRAQVWEAQTDHGTYLMWREDGEIWLADESMGARMLVFAPGRKPRWVQSYAGFPKELYFGVDEVLGVAPQGKDGRLYLKARLRSGAIFTGTGRIQDGLLVPDGFGAISFLDSFDFFAGSFKDGEPVKGALGSSLWFNEEVRKVDGRHVFRGQHLSAHAIGNYIDADIFVGPDRVAFHDVSDHEVVRLKDGSIFEQHNDRSRINAEGRALEQRLIDKNVVGYVGKAAPAVGQAFQLFPDQGPGDACPRCKGSGYCYVWASVSQEKVFSTANGHTDGAWQDATVHRSGHLATCSRCNGSGKP